MLIYDFFKKRTVLFIIFGIVSFFILVSFWGIVTLSLATKCLACPSDDLVPKGTQLKDPYLKKLFEPEFPFESIKVIKTKEGKRYVMIKAKDTVTDEIQNNYEKDTLLKRKIVVNRGRSTKDGTLLISKMTIHRTVSEVPFVVEYSEIKGERVSGNRVEDVIRYEDQYLIILVDKDFGKVFKKVVVYPEKDVPCPTPPIIGKFPGSRSIACYEDDKLFNFVFVAKAKAEDIYDYYRDKLKEHYNKAGFSAPESAWKSQDMRFPQFGIKISTTEFSKWGNFLELMKIVMKQEVTQLYYHGPEFKRLTKSSPVPPDGLVLVISIEKGDKIIPEYALIKVYYLTDPEAIKENIEAVKKRYPGGME